MLVSSPRVSSLASWGAFQPSMAGFRAARGVAMYVAGCRSNQPTYHNRCQRLRRWERVRARVNPLFHGGLRPVPDIKHSHLRICDGCSLEARCGK